MLNLHKTILNINLCQSYNLLAYQISFILPLLLCDHLFFLILLLKLNTQMIVEHNGLQLSSLPTQTHKLLIHIKINTLLNQKLKLFEKQNQNPKHQFQLSSDKSHIKAYVDPSQLSYASYQNILTMDEYYFGPILNKQNQLKLTIDNFYKEKNYYKFTINDPSNLLMKLHKMDLYSLPFNNLSRGGKRMIFSSFLLADTLQKQLKSSIDQKQECKQIYTNLKSVNHVFRLNCFSPESGNFKTYYDTPFSDNKRKLYSKYTLLIYLTGGSNKQNPCLRIENEKIKQIPAFTGIIFDQRYQHEGWPYSEGDKIFLRSELIYHIKDVEHNYRVAEIFNKACYFHKESLYDHQNGPYSEQLQKYSNQLFNYSAKLRYFLAQKKQELVKQNQMKQKITEGKPHEQVTEHFLNLESQYLLKKNFNHFYVTDGNSFWFTENIPLKQSAKLVLVDYFNGRMDILSSTEKQNSQQMKIFSKPFKLKMYEYFNQTKKPNKDIIQKTQEQKPLQQKFTKHQTQQNKKDELIMKFLQQFLLKNQSQIKPYPLDFRSIVDTGIKGYVIQQSDCGICINKYEDLQTSQQYEKQAICISHNLLHYRMKGVGVILFNGKLHIEDQNITIDEQKGQIAFNDAFINKTINFASCQCRTYQKYQVIGKQTVQVQGFLVPRMNYKKLQSCKGYRISIDMFKNGFIHRIKSNISRPYAIDITNQYQEPQRCFYDMNDKYINSYNQ